MKESNICSLPIIETNKGSILPKRIVNKLLSTVVGTTKVCFFDFHQHWGEPFLMQKRTLGEKKSGQAP
jgi:hypothetical protein